MLPHSIHPDATAEAREARLWYEERSPDAAALFMADLDHAMNVISEYPETWPELPNGRRKYVMRRFPFVIIYRVREKDVRVLAVQHGRRRPYYWRDRQ